MQPFYLLLHFLSSTSFLPSLLSLLPSRHPLLFGIASFDGILFEVKERRGEGEEREGEQGRRARWIPNFIRIDLGLVQPVNEGPVAWCWHVNVYKVSYNNKKKEEKEREGMKEGKRSSRGRKDTFKEIRPFVDFANTLALSHQLILHREPISSSNYLLSQTKIYNNI